MIFYMNTEFLTNFLTKLKSAPLWVKIVSIVIVALVSAVLLFSSCSTIRTTMNSAGEIHTSVNQSALDSTHISINLFARPSNN